MHQESDAGLSFFVYLYLYLYLYLCICICICICVFLCKMHQESDAGLYFANWLCNSFYTTVTAIPKTEAVTDMLIVGAKVGFANLDEIGNLV